MITDRPSNPGHFFGTAHQFTTGFSLRWQQTAVPVHDPLAAAAAVLLKHTIFKIKKCQNIIRVEQKFFYYRRCVKPKEGRASACSKYSLNSSLVPALKILSPNSSLVPVPLKILSELQLRQPMTSLKIAPSSPAIIWLHPECSSRALRRSRKL